MFITALCPTYRHPELLKNSLACWLTQDYDPDQRHLIICDDDRTFDSQEGDGWNLVSLPERPASLPAKYNAMLALAPPQTEAFVVWEDDDIYLPGCVSAHARALAGCQFSKPERVFSDYTGRLEIEGAHGRFHSCMAFRRELIEQLGGWPDTRRADFDQQLIGRLTAAADCVADPWPDGTPQFIYRWRSGAAHCQFSMRSPDDTDWWEVNPHVYAPVPYVGKLVAEMDAKTREHLEECGACV